MANADKRTEEAIEEWLITQIADLVLAKPAAIDPSATFESFGLSSREAVMLSGDLEEWLDQRLSPTLIYEYPTIRELARHLAADAATMETVVTVEPASAAQPVRHDEPIAVIGLGCRFPGAPNPQAFWELLQSGTDAVGEIPGERWSQAEFFNEEPGVAGKMYTRHGGFLDAVDQFDPQFFGISPREAERTDPQQRLLMEVTWEALEHAGIAPDRLAGSATGVFVGISSSDYSLLQYGDYEQIDAYTGTGNAASIAANRLSYLLNLRGPSMSIDTACSSSLVTVHLACQSLRNGEANLALAGGVNMILSPELNITFSHARMMSPTGRCRTFDADADGYVRGEGGGVVVLKRLSDALADGDTVLAVIGGTAVNHDGRTNGLTAPSGQAQQSVIRQALHNAGITPNDLSYIEAHGTGTKLGDPIEVEALGHVLQGRALDDPCLLGSVKTNIGHLEAAAGVAGLIKTVLALHHDEIPPHLHFNAINPYIPIDELPLQVTTEKRPFPKPNGRAYAGVSSFGFGGANAHVVLTTPPATAAAQSQPEHERPTQLLTLSARDPQALADMAAAYADFARTIDTEALADLCYTANSGRAHFAHRLAVTAASPTELHDQLTAFAQGKPAAAVQTGEVVGQPKHKVAFLFTGQGAQYVNMGRELYATQPVFRAALDRCAAILEAHLERPLLSVIFVDPDGADADLIHQTAYTQPALFAVEYALAQLWQSWGVQPDVVMGHSVGEYVAACLAGIFSLEDGLKLIAARGRLMQSLPQDGSMAVLFTDPQQVRTVMAEVQGQVDIAAVNGPHNVVISGETAAVAAVTAQMQADGVTVRPLQVSHAFHSPLMDPILDAFYDVARELKYHAPQIGFISNLIGRLWDAEVIPEARYWQRHIRRGVLFANGMTALADAGCNLFVEMGPHPSLIGMGRRCLPPDQPALWLPSLRRNEPDWSVLLRSVGDAFLNGVSLDWAGIDAPYARRKLHLPTYPFQRARYWVDTAKGRQTAVPQAKTASGAHPLLGQRLASPLPIAQYQNQLSAADIAAHTAGKNGALLPAAAMLEAALAAAAQQFAAEAVTLTDVQFDAVCLVTDETPLTTQFIFTPNGAQAGAFAFYSRPAAAEDAAWTQHAAGGLQAAAGQKSPRRQFGVTAVQARCSEQWLPAAPTQGNGQSFQVWLGAEEALAPLPAPSNGQAWRATRLLEKGLQTLAVLTSGDAAAALTHHPAAVQRLRQNGRLADARWVYVTRSGEIWLLDQGGQTLLDLSGVTLRPLPADVQALLHAHAAAVVKMAISSSATSDAAELTAAALRALPQDAQFESLQSYLRAQLAGVLRLEPARIDLERPINFFGLDSIMAIELKHKVEKTLDLNLPIAALLQGPNLTQLTATLLDQLQADAHEPKIAAGANAPGEYPMSHGQRALWIQHQIDPGSVFNPRYAVRVRAALEPAQLKEAFAILTDRHAALRTTFVTRDGEPVQVVNPDSRVRFQMVDAADWTDAVLQAQLQTQAYQPFDLENGPLLRVHLFRRGPEEHVLLLAAHHLVVDLWSLSVLINELGLLLLHDNDPAALPPLSLAYTDYVRWHNEMLDGPRGEALWTYWQEQLAGPLPVLELPTDRPRPAVQTHRGAAQTVALDPALAQQLNAFSDEHGVTLYVTLLAAFKLLLARHAQQEDIIVGTPTTGRSLSQVSDLVGYFVNPVAIRSNVNGKRPFTDLLTNVQQSVVAALDHQDYPIALLVEKLQPDRDPSYLPIFQVMFIMQRSHLLYEDGLSQMSVNGEGARMQLGNLALESLPIAEQMAPFDLTLMAAPSPDGLAMSLSYNTDLYDADTIQRMLAHYQTLLAEIVADAERPLAAIPMLPAAERQELLTAFNEAIPSRANPTILVHEQFARQAAATPNATAVIFGDARLTYHQLNARANQLAHYLRRHGVGPDTLVGICVQKSIDMVVGLLGVLKAGGAYLPLDPAYPADRLAYMVEDAAAPVLLVQDQLFSQLPPLSQNGHSSNRQSSAPKLIKFAADWPAIAQERTDNPSVNVTADNLAYSIYTSGSTGKPKGVLLHHGGLSNLVQAQTRGFGVDAGSRVLQFASFSFDASVSEIFMALFVGGTLVLAPKAQLSDATQLQTVLQDAAISTVTLPPSMLALLTPEALPNLHTLISAGEACTPEIAVRWANGRRFFNAYGPTESTIGPTYFPVSGDWEGQARVPIGKSIDNMQVYLLDEALQPAPIGVPGEIYLGGVGLARGYNNRPAMTAAKFVPNPFSQTPGARMYRTGDVGRYCADGNIEFLGRIDDQVKLRGFRIELGEVNNALMAHTAVQDCAVIVREDAPGDQRLVGYVVAQPGASTPTTSELRTFLGERLPDYMTPSRFVMLEKLPQTPNGKLDRRRLPAPTSERPELDTAFVQPRNETEAQLAQIWQDVLGVDRVGIHDNFFELGGHSLLAAKAHSRIKARFTQQVTVVEMFRYPTVRALAEFLQNDDGGQAVLQEVRQRARQQRQALRQQRQAARVQQQRLRQRARNGRF